MSDQCEELWGKESVSDDPSYIDLFERLRSLPIYCEAVVEQVVNNNEKDDVLATHYRQLGNRLTEKNDFKDAIEQYNKSLCYATNKSVPLSLAFANRAFCFLHLGLYDECLNDIKLAEHANYPDHLMLKLKHRKLICLQEMKASNKRKPVEPQLNFDEDATIPGMANVLAIIRNEEFGRHIIARCDIDEDQVVMIEKPLVKLIDDNSKYKRCHSCLKENTSVIPCSNCTEALFCNGSCYIETLHHYECNMKLFKLYEGEPGRAAQNCVKFLLRAIVIALQSFSSSQTLMEFVESFIAENSSNAIVVGYDAIMGIFLAHSNIVPYRVGQMKILIISCIAYDFIMGQTSLKLKFATKKIQRFLMHLLTHLASMFIANNMFLQGWSDKWINVIEHEGKEVFGTGIFNIPTYFNHACMPNIIRLTTSNHMVVKTIRPIKAGEQIFVRYAIDANWPTQQRRQRLQNLCGFQCNCQLCLCNGPNTSENGVLTSEFDNLSTEISPLIFLTSKDENKWKLMKAKLFWFVKKYEDMPTSKSIILSYEYLRMILTRELFYQAKS